MRNNFVTIGLGSNLDSPINQLREALQQLKKIKNLQVLKVSSFYESDAQLPENSDPAWNKNFLNAVALCECDSSFKPQELLYILKQIEIKMGRIQSEKWAPRIIDLDLLTWGNLKLNEPDLILPHPRIQERPFVLLPLLDVLPGFDLFALPDWANQWVSEKPFRTIRSPSHFWPKLVGILNITTDSFSDGNSLLNPESLVQHATNLLQSGARILDIGAESTRPRASVISPEVELKNLIWAFDLLRPLKKNFKFELSLDCRRASVVREILELHKIDYLNDVSGFSSVEMKDILKKTNIQGFVMHSLSVPADPKNNLDEKSSPQSQILSWWNKKKAELIKHGIQDEKIIFDPGIGFGKTKEQSLYILKNLEQFSSIQNEIMIGHSRKSYQTLFSGQVPAQRDLETALVTNDLNLAYTQYLRLHNLESQKTALRYP